MRVKIYAKFLLHLLQEPKVRFSLLQRISIMILGFHDIVMHFIAFSWCIMHDRLFTLILLICMWWVSSSWHYTTLQCYLSKPLWWHIGLVHNLNDVMVEIEGIYKVSVKYGWMLYWLNSCMMHKNFSLCICFMK